MARRERRPREVQRFHDRMNHARRELLKAVEKAADVDDAIGLLPGHKVELIRRLREYRDEANRAVKVLSE